MGEPVALVGVYDADGGLLGEARYVIGHLLGRTHCALCDITHSPVRRKPAWDAMVAGLGLPVRLVHRNERTPSEQAACTRGLPCVLVEWSTGGLEVLLAPDDLELGGSVEEFARAVRAALGRGALEYGSA